MRTQITIHTLEIPAGRERVYFSLPLARDCTLITGLLASVSAHTGSSLAGQLQLSWEGIRVFHAIGVNLALFSPTSWNFIPPPDLLPRWAQEYKGMQPFPLQEKPQSSHIQGHYENLLSDAYRLSLYLYCQHGGKDD